MPRISIVDESYSRAAPPPPNPVAPYVSIVEDAKSRARVLARTGGVARSKAAPSTKYSQKGVWQYYRRLAEAGLDIPKSVPASLHQLRAIPGSADLQLAALGLGYRSWASQEGVAADVQMCTGDKNLAALADFLGMEISYLPRGAQRAGEVDLLELQRFEQSRNSPLWRDAGIQPLEAEASVLLPHTGQFKLLSGHVFRELSSKDSATQKRFLGGQAVHVPLGEVLDVLRRANSPEWTEGLADVEPDVAHRHSNQLATVHRMLREPWLNDFLLGVHPRSSYETAAALIPSEILLEQSRLPVQDRKKVDPLGTETALLLGFAIYSIAQTMREGSTHPNEISIVVGTRGWQARLNRYLDARIRGLGLLTGLPGMTPGQDLIRHPQLLDQVRNCITIDLFTFE